MLEIDASLRLRRGNWRLATPHAITHALLYYLLYSLIDELSEGADIDQRRTDGNPMQVGTRLFIIAITGDQR
jgi:hypothetical protein